MKVCWPNLLSLVSDVVEDVPSIPDQTSHIPVLPAEFVESFFLRPDGYYVDCTFGRGGHARMLLDKLSPQGRLLGVDRDPEAVAVGKILEAEDDRFCMVHRPFSELSLALEDAGWGQVDGIGFDLGVSSPQLDQAERGFSFQKAGPLDMRMDTQSGESLQQKLKYVREDELATVIRSFGDERYARRIASAIVQAVRKGELNDTRDLENVCFHAMPKKGRYGGAHPATRTFQALRIWVNGEYDEIRSALQQAADALRPGGRLAVISFHSGEDRLVRDHIQAMVNPCTCPPQFPICVCGKVASMRWVQKKPVRASEDELAKNPRSRSALLRVAEKIEVSA